MINLRFTVSADAPAASPYRRILHDYERASGLPRSLDPDYDLDDHQGFPEMCPAKDYWFMPMTKAWQEYQFALLTEYSPVGMSIADRKVSIHASHAGGDNLADAISLE